MIMGMETFGYGIDEVGGSGDGGDGNGSSSVVVSIVLMPMMVAASIEKHLE